MKIPQRTDSGVQEQPLQGGEWRVNPGDFGQKNIEEGNRAVQGMLGEAEKIAIKAQREADEAVQLEAGTLASQKELEWNNIIRTTKGRNALGLAEKFEKDWSKFSSDTKNSIVKNKKQQMMVDRLMSSNYAQLRNNIDAHTAKEMDNFYDEQSVAMISADRQTAIDSGNPERIAESIGKQKAIVTQLANKKGWSFEEYQGKLNDVEKETKMEYVQRLAYTNPEAARKIISDEEEKSVLGVENIDTLSRYISRAEREKKYAQRDMQINNDIRFMSDFSTGKIKNIGDIEKGASPALARAAIAYMSDPELITVENTPVFAKYAEAIYDLNDKSAIDKLFVEVLSGGSDGKPNQKEVETLVKIAAVRSQGLTLSEYDEKQRKEKVEKRKAENKSFVDTAFSAVKSWADKYGKDEYDRMLLKSGLYKEFINETGSRQIKTAEEAQNIAAKVIEKGQAQINPNRTKYQVDKIYDLPAGRLICIGYKDDGTPIFKRAK